MRTTKMCLFAVVVSGTAGLCFSEVGIDPRMFGGARMVAAARPFLASGSDGAAQDGPDTLGFLNGDRLHGCLAGFSLATNGLKWSRADVEQVMAFKPAGIAFVNLAGRAKRDGAQTTATVTLANRDVLGCSVVSIDDKAVVVETAAMGRMTLNRNMVATLAFRGGSGSVLYEGPGDSSEWVFSNSDVPGNRVQGGALFVSYGIAERRLGGFPDMAQVRFTATWGQYPNLSCLVLGETSGSSFSVGYYVTVQASSVYIYKMSRNSGHQHIASMNVEKFGRGAGSAVFDVMIDRKKKVLTLMIDGEVTRTVNESGDLPDGKNLAFGKAGGGDAGVTRISAIRVAQWDGRIAPPGGGAPADVKEDVIRLKNGDKLTGKLDGVAQGKTAVTTSFASLSIPVANVEEILFSAANRETPRRNKMDVRVYFLQSGCLTGDMDLIEGDVLRCRSESFGTVSIPLDSLRRIEFNIYKERSSTSGDLGAGMSVPDVPIDIQ